MKKFIFCLVASITFLNAFSQLKGKNFNFSTFYTDKKRVTPTLEAASSAMAKSHPEYGILPFNSPCRECVELIDKRTQDSRLFMAPNKAGHTWTQKSYFPLHYKKTANDVWHTIDQRLRPDSTNPGVFIAKKQPVPTKLDINKRNASLDLGEMEFSFDNNLTMYFFEDGKAYTRTEAANYTNFTVGEEGLNVANIWKGINMHETFGVGKVETDYNINAPLDIPVSDNGYMVIEDHFTLPDGYTFTALADGPYNKDKYYSGDYVVKNKAGEELVYYRKPIYTDVNSFGMHGSYNLIKEGNNYTVQMMVPVSWLKNPNNIYPLVIDPAREGSTKVGNYLSTQGASANQGFTTYNIAPGYCPYDMTVPVPGNSSLTQTYIQVEWQLKFDNTCQASPPATYPYCTYDQVWQVVYCDSCQTFETVTCKEDSENQFVTICTTDPTIVPGTDSLSYPIITNPPFLNCFHPQCADYIVNFTLRNSDSVCNESCTVLCAIGNLWVMTIEAEQVEVNLAQNKSKVCAGQTIIDTAHAIYGVPPYTYQWVAGTTVYPLTSDSIFAFSPEQTTGIMCYIFDACGIEDSSSVVADSVVPAPPADGGPDQKLCAGPGGTLTLGGNPTTSANATVVWSASDSTALSWLSNDSVDNPTVTIPPATVDTFFYILTATDPQCFRVDTVYVFSGADPVPVIDSSGPTTFCVGGKVTLSSVGTYPTYRWNDVNSSTSPSITISTPGDYQLSVKDGNGCPGVSNVIVVSTTTIPPFRVYPDTTILYGDSIMLYTDANLGSASIDSFNWYPNIYISCLQCDNPEVAPLANQYYGLILYSGGCSATDSALIQIIYPDNFYIPNAFTPNGDGNDDNFYIQAQSGVTVQLFQVFDRWGEKVHDGPNPWDGKYNGKDAPMAVYTYLFKLTVFGNNVPLYRKGSVTLIR